MKNLQLLDAIYELWELSKALEKRGYGKNTPSELRKAFAADKRKKIVQKYLHALELANRLAEEYYHELQLRRAPTKG